MSEQNQGFYIFEGLSQKEIAYFIMMSETLKFHKGETIMLEGDASDDRAYFIESGSVDVY
jgi:CRP-like cAMP-binding protein